MEDRTRPFEAVSIGMARHETPEDRFPEDGHALRPQGAPYRVNLTALSQRYNLYLVGMAEEIHVYEPKFPDQTLGGPPQLILIPELADDERSGYILEERPHCINHLIVGTLGDQEIVVIATDSGNVTAYNTSAIFHAIQNGRAEDGPLRNPVRTHLRPFFAQSVAESAWGLAIHSQGRMIAVSCNAGEPDRGNRLNRANAEITVFAFALVSEHPSDSSTDSTDTDDQQTGEWSMWEPTTLGPDQESFISCRKKNYKIVLAGPDGHANNIPYISFINGDQDRTGAWLLSVGLNQEMKVWQIWSAKCCRSWRPDTSTSNITRFAPNEFGWIVAPLNPEMFRPLASMEAFVGHSKVKQYWGRQVTGDTFDISTVVQSYVPSNGRLHPQHPEFDEEWTSDDDEPYLVGEDLSESDATADEAETIDRRPFPSETRTSPSLSTRAATPPPIYNALYSGGVRPVWTVDTADEERSAPDHTDLSEDEVSDADVDDGSTGSFRSTTSISSFHSQTSRDHDNRNSSASSQSPATSPRDAPEATPQPRKPSVSLTSRPADQCPSIRLPNLPILHCSTSHIRLFGSANAKGPHVFCARLLKQVPPQNRLGHAFEAFDRLNMIEQIPELGVVIIASQSGRCAICTLTKRRADNLLGLRVDWVVPTQEQEHAGLRPDEFLLGIAVGPVQGRYTTSHDTQREHDPESWKKDRVINGIPTTFASTVIDVNGEAASTSRIYLDESDEDDDDDEEEDSDEDDEDDEDDDDDDDNDNAAEQGDGGDVDGDDDVENDHDNEAEAEDMEPPSGRARPRSPELSLSSCKPFDWTRGPQSDAWAAIESSRRYRLMMTYRDLSVLTYEISRGVERDDIRVHVD